MRTVTNWEDEVFEQIPRNSFVKGKHPDICPDCKKEPILADINMPFTASELWIATCDCRNPKRASGDSITDVITNWNNMLKKQR